MTRGRPIPAHVIRLIRRLRQTMNISQAARAAGVSRPTVYKYSDRKSSKG